MTDTTINENLALIKRVDTVLDRFLALDANEQLMAWTLMRSLLRRQGLLPAEEPQPEPVKRKRGRPEGSRTRVKPDKSMGVPE